MRVLVVSNMYPSADSPAFGVFVKRITEQKVQAGLQVQLVARQGDKGNKLLSYLGFYWRAFWAVIFSRHDVVYLHFATHSYPPVGLALLFRSLPLVVHVHGADVVPENPAKKLRAAVLGVITALSLIHI